jgi:IS30 family transposase
LNTLGYKHFDYRKRCQIYGLWRAGYSQCEIAKEIGVHKSTISRELNRNITFVRTKLGSWQYKPDYAQGYAKEGHHQKPKKIKLTEQASVFIRGKLHKSGVQNKLVAMQNATVFFLSALN